MSLCHSGRVLLKLANISSSFEVTSSDRLSVAFLRRGPQCPHLAACFINSLVFVSGRTPAATLSHSTSATHSGPGATFLGPPRRTISFCADLCICTFRLHSRQDSTCRCTSTMTDFVSHPVFAS